MVEDVSGDPGNDAHELRVVQLSLRSEGYQSEYRGHWGHGGQERREEHPQLEVTATAAREWKRTTEQGLAVTAAGSLDKGRTAGVSRGRASVRLKGPLSASLPRCTSFHPPDPSASNSAHPGPGIFLQ